MCIRDSINAEYMGKEQTRTDRFSYTMNIFRLIGDMLHLLSIIFLIMKIRNSRNCLGLSLKTQECFLIVFCLRYLDLFMYFVSLYNTVMKIAFISSTVYIIYLMKFQKPYCLSYDPLGDDFPHYKFLIPGAIVATILIHTDYSDSYFELIWSFSIWLEAVAIIPQLRMLTKIKEVENITGNYMACLGLYRFFYILNWIYRWYQDEPFCLTSTLGGIVQTVIYGDFFYYYWLSLKTGKGISLPVQIRLLKRCHRAIFFLLTTRRQTLEHAHEEDSGFNFIVCTLYLSLIHI
eukprot:TRINITY_DN1512_c0_g1_i1.p2 TRINITY_DN1512_c0_g1~~TRINITY_DN1512_c0_g1_i1.p2  ORF type:complete len:306 (-),score=73.90 TRINITY_DN1512_c0_g1_i1:118-987(-)